MNAAGCICRVNASGAFETRGCEVHEDTCECGHYHFNHGPNDGACKVFVVRKGDSCGCAAFRPKKQDTP